MLTQEYSGGSNFVRVGSLTELTASKRLHVKVQGRYVSVIEHNGKLFCIDSTCYHAGGPLGLGDIEEINGDPCVVCPWHFYKVSLSEGSKLYQPLAMSAEGKLVPSKEWKKKENAQRTHAVELRDEGVYVCLSSEAETYDSDEYGKNALCGQQCSSGKESKVKAIAGSDGRINGGFRSNTYGSLSRPLRSGHVLNPSKEYQFSNRLIHRAATSGNIQKNGMNPSSSNAPLLASVAKTLVEPEGERGYRLEIPLNEDQNRPLREWFAAIKVDPKEAEPCHVFCVYHLVLCIENSLGTYVSRKYTFKDATVSRRDNPETLKTLRFSLRRYARGSFTSSLTSRVRSLRVESADTSPRRFLDGISWAQLDCCFLFGGGSGVTPLIQIMRNLVACSKSKMKVILFYANANPKSALAMENICELTNLENITIFVKFLYSEARMDANWEQKMLSFGNVSISWNTKIGTEVIRDYLTSSIGNYTPSESVLVYCGPSGFNSSARKIALDLSIREDMCLGLEG